MTSNMADATCVRCAENTVPPERMTCDLCMDEIYRDAPHRDPRKPQLPSDDGLIKALEGVLVGGNHLALLIGADHPPYTTHPRDALEHYGSCDAYEIWCCWRSIMLAREALSRHKAPLSVERTPYCPNCGESCLDKWHSSHSVAGDDVEREANRLFNEAFMQTPNRGDREERLYEAGKRALRAVLTALQVTEGNRCRKCNGARMVQENNGPPVPCSLCAALHSKQEGG